MARGRRFRPTARRKLIWARNGDISAPTAAGDAIDLLADFRADGGSSLGATITRTHLTFQIFWNNYAPVGTANQLFVGLIVDQLQADQSEVPRPAVELHADWMYWKAHPAVPEYSALTSAVGGATTTSLVSTVVIDSKSQRKCEELGQTLWLVLDPTYTGTATATISWSSSVLLKLP